MCRETDLRSFRAQLIEVEFAPWKSIDDRSGEVEAMTGADHRGERFLAALPVRMLCGKWPDPPAPGEAYGGVDGLLGGQLSRRLAVGFVNSGRPERLTDAPSSVSPIG